MIVLELYGRLRDDDTELDQLRYGLRLYLSDYDLSVASSNITLRAKLTPCKELNDAFAKVRKGRTILWNGCLRHGEINVELVHGLLVCGPPDDWEWVFNVARLKSY